MEFKYKKVEVKPEQRIFVFGDVHGAYHLVEKAFKVLGIQDSDVKVFLGDLEDRGSQNIKCLEKVQPHNPNTYCVLGNHEHLYYAGVIEGSPDHYQCWIQNGGDITAEEVGHDNLEMLAPMIEWMPTALEVVRGDKSYGFTHADWPPFLSSYAFQEIKSSFMKHQFGGNLFENLIWSRAGANATTQGIQLNSVKGVEYIFHGHSYMKKPTINANRVFIDTGGVFNGNLSVAVIEPDGELWFYSTLEED